MWAAALTPRPPRRGSWRRPQLPQDSGREGGRSPGPLGFRPRLRARAEQPRPPRPTAAGVRASSPTQDTRGRRYLQNHGRLGTAPPPGSEPGGRTQATAAPRPHSHRSPRRPHSAPRRARAEAAPQAAWKAATDNGEEPRWNNGRAALKGHREAPALRGACVARGGA